MRQRTELIARVCFAAQHISPASQRSATAIYMPYFKYLILCIIFLILLNRSIDTDHLRVLRQGRCCSACWGLSSLGASCLRGATATDSPNCCRCFRGMQTAIGNDVVFIILIHFPTCLRFLPLTMKMWVGKLLSSSANFLLLLLRCRCRKWEFIAPSRIVLAAAASSWLDSRCIGAHNGHNSA